MTARTKKVESAAGKAMESLFKAMRMSCMVFLTTAQGEFLNDYLQLARMQVRQQNINS